MALRDVLDDVTNVDGFTMSFILGAALIILYWRLFVLRLDAQEPPILKSRIPVVGHILGMLYNSHGYWKMLHEKEPMPACTLPMLSGKMYIINEPSLVSAVFRARTLSFDPYLFKTIKYMVPISAKAMGVLSSEDFWPRWVKVVYSSMTGTDLFKMNVVVLRDIFRQINGLPMNMEVEDTTIWLRGTLTTSTVTALLGKDNPFTKDRSLIGKFWEFEKDLAHFVLGPAPWLTSSSAYEARADMHKALTEYFSSAAPSAPDVSELARAAISLQDEHHWTPEDKAALMIGILQGALSNTIPTFFWFAMHIFSQPSLVAKLRKELKPLAVAGAKLPGGKQEMLLDVRIIEDRAPLLVAAFRENQRAIGVGSINRWVEADTRLTSAASGKTYLLKKDTPLLVPTLVNHQDPALWGADAAEYKAERFLRRDGDVREFHAGAPVPRGAYTPFGGGKHLCPGRDFANAENWGTMIAFLLGFDITTPEGGPLEVPERTMPLPTSGLGRPVPGSDLRSSVRRRKGWENIVWKVVEA
ncbi:cytochrome P450 [Pestalotiopsis sp. NC0098]|nr:cytochrome P450 [Pestalotiopsis sp. NC0098]